MDRDEGNPKKTPIEGQAHLRLISRAIDETETIDLNKMITPDLTESGSFDVGKISHAAFGKLLQALSVPTLLISRSHEIAFANEAFSTIPKAPFNATGETFSSLFGNPKEAREAQLLLEGVFEKREPRVEERILQVHGTRIWARLHLRTIRLGSEKLALVQIENLTAQKQLRTIQKYRKLVNIFPLGMAEFALADSLDLSLTKERLLEGLLDAKIVDGNFEFARMYNRSAMDELKGMRLGTLFPCRGKRKTMYETWIRAGFPTYTFETKEKLLYAPSYYFENTLIGNVSKNRLLGFWWLKRDISERKRADQEILRGQKLESLGILAGGIAHDFNNLLTGIIGNISLAQNALEPGNKALDRLAAASTASTRAQELTRQLLTFSRGGVPIKKTASIVELLRDSVTFVTRGSKVRCEFSIPENLWPIDMDVGQIHQVINNLVINALQAMPDGGVITVQGANLTVTGSPGVPLKKGDYVRISIKDTGIGIPQEYLQKIFDPYFTTKEKGTGLGLATAYSVIKKHEGLMTVESEVGVGTTFHFYLPACTQATARREPEVGEAVKGRGNILVMDDDDLIRDLAGELLTMLGYEVTFARNGAEAVVLYQRAVRLGKPFDVAIMDLTIPGGLGAKEAVEKMLQIDPNIKAVVSSGYSTDPIMTGFAEHGFVGALPKPYNANDLSRLLQRIMSPNDGG